MTLLLTNDEIKKLDDYWKFIDFFSKAANKAQSVHDFRKNIIKKIQKEYSPTEFYFFETMLNKMLWTLLYKYKIDINKMNMTTTLTLSIQNSSCINKQIIIHNDKYFIFPLYKQKNKLPENLYKILHILSNKNLYDKIIDDSNYPLDYPFPNVNLMYYNNSDKKHKSLLLL